MKINVNCEFSNKMSRLNVVSTTTIHKFGRENKKYFMIFPNRLVLFTSHFLIFFSTSIKRILPLSLSVSPGHKDCYERKSSLRRIRVLVDTI